MARTRPPPALADAPESGGIELGGDRTRGVHEDGRGADLARERRRGAGRSRIEDLGLAPLHEVAHAVPGRDSPERAEVESHLIDDAALIEDERAAAVDGRHVQRRFGEL